MKNVFFIIAFLGLFQLASAQDATNNLTVRVSLSETEGEKAKLLKGLENGKLFKGESRTVFLIETSTDKAEALKNELTAIFPTCKVEEVN